MLKNTETQQKIDEKKKRYFFKYFSFRLIGAIQATDVTTPRRKKKKKKKTKKPKKKKRRRRLKILY